MAGWERGPAWPMLRSLLARGSRAEPPPQEAPAQQAAEAGAGPAPLRVLVTGAAGQTGSLVVRRLLELGVGPSGRIAAVRGLVRNEERGEELRRSLEGISLAGLEIVVGDVTDSSTLQSAFKGMDAVVVLTSAQPRISKMSLARVIALKLATFNMISARPSFWFDEGQGPEEVDWLGQRAQFDAAQEAGVRHVVLVSSMCGTKPDHFLNTQMGNIVLWKRKAECYLIKCKLNYTIIHPGGLLPHAGGGGQPAPGGKRQLYVGVNDELLADGQIRAMVPRQDLAEICVQCLLAPSLAVGRSFDLGSGPEGEGEPFTGNLKALLATLEGRNCSYTEADEVFCSLELQKNRGCSCT